jgi:hypothetical protein
MTGMDAPRPPDDSRRRFSFSISRSSRKKNPSSENNSCSDIVVQIAILRRIDGKGPTLSVWSTGSSGIPYREEVILK